jgi:hypothetical protein
MGPRGWGRAVPGVDQAPCCLFNCSEDSIPRTLPFARRQHRVCARRPVHRKWDNPVSFRWITSLLIHRVATSGRITVHNVRRGTPPSLSIPAVRGPRLISSSVPVSTTSFHCSPNGGPANDSSHSRFPIEIAVAAHAYRPRVVDVPMRPQHGRIVLVVVQACVRRRCRSLRSRRAPFAQVPKREKLKSV